MIAAPIVNQSIPYTAYILRLHHKCASQLLRNIQIHSGFEVVVIGDEMKTGAYAADVALNFMARNILLFPTDFFCHFRHTFGINLAKPRFPAFDIWQCVIQQQQRQWQWQRIYVNSAKLLILPRQKWDRIRAPFLTQEQQQQYRFNSSGHISFEISEFPCVLI